MESCVGTEYVPFKTPLAMEGKVMCGPGLRGIRQTSLASTMSFHCECAKDAMSSHCCLSASLQVEAYMGGVVSKMRTELREVMGACVRDYPAKPREQWMFDWPSQVALVRSRAAGRCVMGGQRLGCGCNTVLPDLLLHCLVAYCVQMVNQMYWCLEVEEAFEKLGKGDKNAMKVGMAADVHLHRHKGGVSLLPLKAWPSASTGLQREAGFAADAPH